MFEPGHLHIRHVALQASEVSYDIHLHYELSEDPKQGTGVHFTVKGDINDQSFSEAFRLPRDLAYNFAHDVSRIAIKHGLPNSAGLPLTQHKDYDRMFADIRDKLHARPGDPVKPEHLT